MKLYDAGITALILIISAIGVGAVSIYFMGDDNAVEEFTEEVIENTFSDAINVDREIMEGKIDLSFDSDDPDDKDTDRH